MADDVSEKKVEIPRSEKLEELANLLDKRTECERAIAYLEEHLREQNDKFHELDSLKIPDLFDELGLKKLTLKDGRVVEVKLKYAASITEENADSCFDWLTKSGNESIIKHEVKINLKKGEKEEHEKIVKFLNAMAVAYKDKNSVHPQTLAAFVKEQMENGSDFPQELFKVYPLRSTKVK
jgi:predicted DNA-binding antitoxin AbrB/MazE fold protein